MTDTSNAAWHPDPSGRYAQRYYDGTRWTEDVVDAAGVQSTDLVDAAPEAPVAPPTTAAPTADAPTGGYQPSGAYAPSGGYGQSGGYGYGQGGGYGQAGGEPSTGSGEPGGYGQPAGYQSPGAPTPYSPSGTTARSGPPVGPGVIVVAVGLVLVVLSLFVLDWFSEGGFELTLGDIRDLLDLAGAEDSGLNALSEAYINFGWLVGLVGAGLALAATLVRQVWLRLAAIVVVALAGAWHLATVIDLAGDDSPDLAIGAYLGVAGCAVVLVGAALGPRRA